jgi:molecular chaperone DnaK
MFRCEEAKKALSQRPTFTLVVSARGKTTKVSLSRAGFESASAPLLTEVERFAASVRDRAGLKAWSEVDALILTGGGTRIPTVRKLVVTLLGREPVKGLNPDEGVAIGSLYWGLFARFRAKDAPAPAQRASAGSPRGG